MKKTGILIAEGFEEIEAVTAADVLRRGGVDAKLISVTGKLPVTGAHGITVTCDELLDQQKLMELDALALPGGMPGTLNLQNDPAVISALSAFSKTDKLLCAICAAPKVLGEMGLLKGLSATCYPGFEVYLKGAEYTGADWTLDGNILTGKGPGLAMSFALRILAALSGEEKAREVQEDLLFRE